MFNPSITSFFKEEVSSRPGKAIEGLKFANKSSSDLIFSNPFSGFFAGSKLSHFGPPTPPRKIASESLAISIVESDIGEPSSSIAVPPIRRSVTSTSKSCFSET